MSTEQRDKHFQGFAKQQFDDVDDMFSRLFSARQDCVQAEETEAANDIQLYMARRAYDLACHTICAYDDVKPEFAIEMLDHIPDMDELPKEQE